MTERPTPMTEAFLKRNATGFGIGDFARKLERELSEAREKVEAYWTVLSLIGERLPDCPVIGDYPGGIDLLKQKLERRDALLRNSKLFDMFLRQGFWHAHHVDLVWRYNGEDVREQADWLKELWYLQKELA